jgi:hypothetical protein
MYNGKEWGRFSADGNLGLGTATPAFKLDVIGVTETSIHCRSTSTTGYSELYMQNDNSIAGGGLVMYGSFYLGDADKRNALELSNEIGGVHISSSGNMVINTDSGTQINTRGNLSVSGNLFIGKADATAFGSALVVFNDNYRSNTSQAGVNMGYSANGFGASLGLIGTATGNCQIEFGSRTDLGVADGYIRWNNSSDTMTLGADVITFNTNPTVPHTERARFLADGRFIVNSNTAVATYAGSVLQTKGRIAIAGYDGSDVNPVIEFIDSSGAVRYFYYTGTASGSFILTGYLGLNKTATYQIDLSTDLARKLSTSTWAVTSDRRLKENIVDADLNICYNNIRKLRLRRYNYIDSFGIDDKTGKKLYEDKNQLGFIAQEVAEIYPKAVHTTDESENGGLEDQLSLDLDQLNRTLFGAVQRLMQKVEDLQEQQIKERIQYKVMEDKQTKRILQLEKVVTQHTLTLENIRKVLLTKGISV